MSVLDSYSVPRARLVAGWSRTVIDWAAFNGDDEFAMPAPNPDGTDSSCWIRPSVVEALGQRASLGPSARRRRGGLLTVQVFVPRGQGEARAMSLAGDLEALFRDYEASGVTYLEPVTRRVVGEPGDPWWQVNVEVPFRRDEIL